jgi:hypothetical protein
VLLADRIYRVLESGAGQRVVQEWTSGYWMPSLVPLFELQDGRLASPEDLARHRVPMSEDALPVLPPVWVAPSLYPLPHQDGVARFRKAHDVS